MKRLEDHSKKPRLEYLDILGCSVRAEFGKYGNARLTLPMATDLFDHQVVIVSEAKNEKDMEELEIILTTDKGDLILEAYTYYEGKEEGFGCELKKKY